MSASWYDVLGVDRGADSEEIRAAWKSSIADLDPTDRRFGLYNEAAGVLLDAEKRREYDAALPATPEPDAAVGEDVADDGSSTEAGAAPTDPEVDETGGPGLDVPLKLLAALTVLLLVVLAVAATLHFTFDDPADTEASMAEARKAAENSVAKVVAYDYKSPETSHDQAMRVLTGDLKTDYDAVWNDAVAPNLEKSKATLTSTVTATGLVRSSSGGDRVKVLTVLQVHAVNAEGTQDALVTVTATMVNQDGTWLIAELDGWDPSLAEDPSESADPSKPADPSASGSSGPSPKPSGATPSPAGSAPSE